MKSITSPNDKPAPSGEQTAQTVFAGLSESDKVAIYNESVNAICVVVRKAVRENRVSLHDEHRLLLELRDNLYRAIF